MQKYNQRHHFLSSLRLQQFSGCVSTFVTITVNKSVKEVGNLFKSILHSDFCTFVQTLNNSFLLILARAGIILLHPAGHLMLLR